MFAGILGTWDLLQNVPQAIAVNDRALACAAVTHTQRHVRLTQMANLMLVTVCL